MYIKSNTGFKKDQDVLVIIGKIWMILCVKNHTWFLLFKQQQKLSSINKTILMN